jgi:spermidine synthase
MNSGRFENLQFEPPFIHEEQGTKSLHFTFGELQSRMRINSPWHLEVDYTRTMMGFLLFNNCPANILMIGLGGGSLAKFCYRQLAQTRITVAEINPHVIALRDDFQVPPDDARFDVMACDGALWVHDSVAPTDVLMVDGFDTSGQPAQLCSQAFYDDCFQALSPQGMLVANLHYDHASYGLLTDRISRSFNGAMLEAVAAEKSNGIIFAFKDPSMVARVKNLKDSLEPLDAQARMQLRPEFGRILWQMKNPDL